MAVGGELLFRGRMGIGAADGGRTLVRVLSGSCSFARVPSDVCGLFCAPFGLHTPADTGMVVACGRVTGGLPIVVTRRRALTGAFFAPLRHRRPGVRCRAGQVATAWPSAVR
jgi:hypothetical protein